MLKTTLAFAFRPVSKRETQEVNFRNRKQNKHEFYLKIKSISKINCPEPIETTTLNHFKYKENSFVEIIRKNTQIL